MHIHDIIQLYRVMAVDNAGQAVFVDFLHVMDAVQTRRILEIANEHNLSVDAEIKIVYHKKFSHVFTVYFVEGVTATFEFESDEEAGSAVNFLRQVFHNVDIDYRIGE